MDVVERAGFDGRDCQRHVDEPLRPICRRDNDLGKLGVLTARRVWVFMPRSRSRLIGWMIRCGGVVGVVCLNGYRATCCLTKVQSGTLQ